MAGEREGEKEKRKENARKIDDLMCLIPLKVLQSQKNLRISAETTSILKKEAVINSRNNKKSDKKVNSIIT